MLASKNFKTFLPFLGTVMPNIRMLFALGFLMAACHSHASDVFILAQATSTDNAKRSNSGNSVDKKSDTIVISTPKPRERVVPQTPQPSPPVQMPIIVMPTAPQR
jgi:hypothetical protein